MYKVYKKTIEFGTEPEEIKVKVETNGRQGEETITHVRMEFGDWVSIEPKEIILETRGQWGKEMLSELLCKTAEYLEE